jgi:hypothetical protein
VPVEVALVSEAGGGRGRGDRLAGLEQAAGDADAVGDLQRVGWEPGVARCGSSSTGSGNLRDVPHDEIVAAAARLFA